MPTRTFIERCASPDQPGWLEMRVALWPDATAEEHRGYMAISLAQPQRFLQLMIYARGLRRGCVCNAGLTAPGHCAPIIRRDRRLAPGARLQRAGVRRADRQ